MKISAVPSIANTTSLMPTPQIATTPEKDAVQELPITGVSETKEAEATQPLSPQFAELAKRRRALQLQERALKEREKALADQGTGSDRIDIARLKNEPLRVLQEAGVTYDQLTEHLLANQEDAKVRALEAKLEALEQGVEKKFIDRETQAEKQVLAEMRREVEDILAKDETFELVKAHRKAPDVMKLIERTYHETGEVLTEMQALKLVEDHLFEEQKRLTGLSKIKSLFAPETPVTQPQQQTGMRTLKNRDTASTALSRRARALAAFTNMKQ